ncbi:MAG TPA: type I restriction enzyme HsdR N-terminal domain-containing protein [Dissulfurispiraceae bacterium]|nr:type I restriction enzyme HsdR N-terminal domain-containing protein [Dissulfurispiraceae bacterium]
MSNYIELGRIPTSRDDRQSLIAEQVAREDRVANMGVDKLRSMVAEYLTSNKGYLNEEIETEREFRIEVNGASFIVKADVLVKVGDRNFMMVKCAMSSPASWERYSVALCRVACSEAIPFCLVTDGEQVRMINVQTAKSICENFAQIPTRQAALDILTEISKKPFYCARPDQEKRILYAFSGIGCPTNEGKSSQT